MRQYLRHIWAFISLVIVAGCSFEELNPEFALNNDSNQIKAVGRITRFSDKDVETRGPKEGNEADISSATIAIFPVTQDGSGIEGNCVYYLPNQKSPSFLIERVGLTYNKRYAIYIFANVEMPVYNPDELEEGVTLDELLSISQDVSNVQRPSNGFPMIGSIGDTFSNKIDKDGQKLILSPTDSNGKLIDPEVNDQSTPILNIPLKALYAKINFTIEVPINPDATVEGNQQPQFTLEKYEIRNIPNSVDFDNSTNSNNDVIGYINEQLSGNTQASGSNKINFSFYLPERLLTPAKKIEEIVPYVKGQYPTEKDKDQNGYRDEDEDKFQRYKPKFIDSNQKATNVYIKGRYRNHQNHFYDVEYTIYLGGDNYYDFHILRNVEYHNYVSINGITTSDDMEETVLVDHRVNIERTQPANITLLREVMLDSHFEVRPLRIKMNTDIKDQIGDINAVKVEVVNPTTTQWMRLERSFNDGTVDESPTMEIKKADGSKETVSVYIDNADSPSYGKRRYFTENLVTVDLKNSTSVILPIVENSPECCWIYIDECNDYGDGVRSGAIKVSYGTDTDSGFIPTSDTRFPAVQYTLNQRKLFRVQYPTGEENKPYRYYNIEYHEEYLHNYDSNDSFQQTHYEGMPWGAEKVQFSHQYPAVYVDITGGVLGWLKEINLDLTDVVNGIIEDENPKYDFYLSRDQKALDVQVDNPDEPGYNGIIIRDYSGHTFSQELIATLFAEDEKESNNGKDFISNGTLASTPLSAVEYCYNKNKRNNFGEVTDPVWYLPAIDEIEEVVMSEYIGVDNKPYNTYARFIDFQDKFYWSSQPAYVQSQINLTVRGIFITYGTAEGKLFVDNIGDKNVQDPGSARATRVSLKNNTYSAITSGLSGPAYSVSYTSVYGYLGDPTRSTFSPAPKPDEGYKSRKSLARVRCVRQMPENNNL